MKKRLSIVLGVVLTVIILLLSSTSLAYAWDYHVWNSLDMQYYSESGRTACGPCSGTSIGRYYNNEGYYALPGYGSKWAPMYDRLKYHMGTTWYGFTHWDDYGPGFVAMTEEKGYDNFSYEYYSPYSDAGPVTDDFYWVIEEAIDNGWPVALASIDMWNGFRGVDALPGSDGNGNWPCTVWHWIAIRGYEYSASTFGYTWGYQVVCTDSYSHADELWLDWRQLVDEVGEDNLRAYVIKD